MPLYEYQCRKCGVTIEKLQKFSDSPLTRCEKCGGALERLVSSSSIKFKGSGWYITDYAKKSSPPAGNNSSGSKSESKTESAKPATPAPTKPAAETK